MAAHHSFVNQKPVPPSKLFTFFPSFNGSTEISLIELTASALSKLERVLSSTEVSLSPLYESFTVSPSFMRSDKTRAKLPSARTLISETARFSTGLPSTPFTVKVKSATACSKFSFLNAPSALITIWLFASEEMETDCIVNGFSDFFTITFKGMFLVTSTATAAGCVRLATNVKPEYSPGTAKVNSANSSVDVFSEEPSTFQVLASGRSDSVKSSTFIFCPASMVHVIDSDFSSIVSPVAILVILNRGSNPP